MTELDVGNELFKKIHEVLTELMNLDPDKDTPAGNLLLRLAEAVSEYENNYFKFGDE